MANLTDFKAKHIKPTDKPLADGTVSGLRLMPGRVNGHGKWELRFVSPATNKRRDMGLGTYPEISIIEARMAASAARDQMRNGIDPIEERKSNVKASILHTQALTFEDAARKVHADLKPGWKNPKHGSRH